MNFNPHSEYRGKHALLSASKYSWLNYTREQLIDVIKNSVSAARGTELHDLAARLIKNKVKLPRSKRTFNRYINDSIGFRMTPEQVLFYSDRIYGTADAISFTDGLLRIFDLKTGRIPAKMDQLKIYAALFCLEYEQEPDAIGIELRIYQNDDLFVEIPDPEEITSIMNRIIDFDQLIVQTLMESEDI